MAIGTSAPFCNSDIALKVCLDQNSKPPKPTTDVSHLYINVLFSPLLAYTLSRNRGLSDWRMGNQLAKTSMNHSQWEVMHSYHRSRQSSADQSLWGENRCVPDLRNTRNVKFNPAEKREGCGWGGMARRLFCTISRPCQSWSKGFFDFPEEEQGFWWRKCGRRGSHPPLFIVTRGLQEHFACKSLPLLYTFVTDIVAITVNFHISRLFPVNFSYRKPWTSLLCLQLPNVDLNSKTKILPPLQFQVFSFLLLMK